MSSFKKRNALLRPRDYVTPSPPLYAVEPLSPVPPTESLPPWDASHPPNAGNVDGECNRVLPELFSQENERAQYSHRSTGSMDLFASIALATQHASPTSEMNKRPDKRTVNGYYEDNRPAKRARSEKLPSPDVSRKNLDLSARPVTSWDQSLDSRLKEAELLLHFSQRAVDERPRAITLPTENKPTHSPHDRPSTPRGADEDPNQTTIEQDDLQASKDQCHASQLDVQEHANPDVQDVNAGDNAGGTADQSPLQESSHEILPPSDSLSDPVPDKPPDGPTDPLSLTSSSYNKSTDQETNQPDLSETYEQPKVQESHNELTKSPLRCDSHSYCTSPHNAGLQTNDTGELSERLTGPLIETTESQLQTQELLAGISDNNPSASIDEETIQQLANAFGENSEPTAAEHKEEVSRSRTAAAVCAACNFAKNSLGIEGDQNATSWISCDGCKSWFHFACAGFKTEREVRSVDKFRCRKCKPVHGATTYVRKSSRAHTAIDYAGLHQGVIKTSDDRPEHHYIQPIKEGTISFLPEKFPRMRPELVTADYFEKGGGMKEPIVIPAELNPRPDTIDEAEATGEGNSPCVDATSDRVPDEGQDALDMVMPRGLTVRRVAELYGPEEKIEVIDVKSQNGEGKKWNMRRWVGYYESRDDNKTVRNVISLEVSQSRLGRLIRRPQIVRDLDLQDAVWPEDLTNKGEYPHVQFYCLMSVADCFTDFHIDFGGSSVFYHILKGSKTFLFIAPKEKNLKKYEEWCMSPAQNWTFLPDQTKECYRVDLKEGDTMLIPSGWIHAVWTPQDSLVIGGNFLTRMNYGMQLRIAQVEKNTGVARKFRYPHFQKLHWFTIFRYLEEDPLPSSVREHLESGYTFERQNPAYYEFDNWGENSNPHPENYHARYYSQAELDGLPELVRYVLRTVLIDIGAITEGITAETRNAVKKSIPRNHGEPLDVVKTFALWCAWKRGNEPIPYWAYPDAVVENAAPDKLSFAASKKLAEEAALKAPRRQSARMQSLKEGGSSTRSNNPNGSASVESDPQENQAANGEKRSFSHLDEHGSSEGALSPSSKRQKMNGGTGSHRKTACDSCRRRRRACKHKVYPEAPLSNPQVADVTSIAPAEDLLSGNALQEKLSTIGGLFNSIAAKHEISRDRFASPSAQDIQSYSPSGLIHPPPSSAPIAAVSHTPGLQTDHNTVSDNAGTVDSASPSRPRTKACNHCRKSKRRCIHDAFGNEDPVKVAETAIPRPHARKVKRAGSFPKSVGFSTTSGSPKPAPIYQETPTRAAPVANMLLAPVNDPIAKDETASEYIHHDRLHMQTSARLDEGAVCEETEQHESDLDTQLAEPIAIDPALMADVSLSEGTRETREKMQEMCFEAMPASSLVSPPASACDTSESSSSTAQVTPTKSRPPSRQSSQPAQEHYQRYTPESGSIGRASHSSTGEANSEKNLSKPQQTRPPSIPQADEESLRLIKELQAQDLGLRRRNKA